LGGSHRTRVGKGLKQTQPMPYVHVETAHGPVDVADDSLGQGVDLGLIHRCPPPSERCAPTVSEGKPHATGQFRNHGYLAADRPLGLADFRRWPLAKPGAHGRQVAVFQESVTGMAVALNPGMSTQRPLDPSLRRRPCVSSMSTTL